MLWYVSTLLTHPRLPHQRAITGFVSSADMACHELFFSPAHGLVNAVPDPAKRTAIDLA